MSSIKDLATSASAPSPTGNAGPVRGALIVLEGLDRSGKTTQSKLLMQRLIENNKNVTAMRFPDRTTPIGQMIDSYLRGQSEIDDHAIHLLFSANRWEASKKITTLLEAGTTVVCDRYYYSGIVYSAAKQNPALPLSWARAPEAGLPRPDLVVFLDLDEAHAQRRGGFGEERYEQATMQRRVRELFRGLSTGRVGGAGAVETSASVSFREEEEDLRIVDASLGVEEVSQEIWKLVEPRLNDVNRGELGKTVRVVT